MRSIRNSLRRLARRAPEAAEPEAAAPTPSAPSNLPRRSASSASNAAPRQPGLGTSGRIDDLLSDRPGYAPVATSAALKALLSRPSSLALVELLHAERQKTGRHADETAIEGLAKRPQLTALLLRSPAVVERLTRRPAVLDAVLKTDDPSDALIDEPLFHRSIDLLERADDVKRALYARDLSPLVAQQERAQAQWMGELLGEGAAQARPRNIAQVISFLPLPGSESFASGCPKKKGASLANFLTLAARQNAVIVSLMPSSDFGKPRYASAANYLAAGDHETVGLRWSAHDVSRDWEREVDPAAGQPAVSRHRLEISLEGDSPRHAEVLQFNAWPDLKKADLRQLDQLMDAVEEKLAERHDAASAAHPGLMVHCYMGIDRTSMFCAMLAMRRASRQDRPLPLEDVLATLCAARREETIRPFADLNQLAMVLDYADQLERRRAAGLP